MSPSQPRIRKRRGPALIRELLRYAASSSADNEAEDRGLGLRWEEVDERQLQYVSDAGLAAFLYRAAQDTIEQAPAAWRDALTAADLTARVVYGNVCECTNEILDACRERGVRVTLLKGISTGKQYYPSAWLRPMHDIDLLVAKAEQKWIESMMIDRGYVPMPNFQVRDIAPHGVPMYHRQRRVWIEIHTALFPKGERLVRKGLFGPSQLTGQAVASTFHGRPVNRFTPELQLLYIASYWMRDLSNYAFHASFVAPLLDALYLLNASGQTLDWDALLGWLDGDIASASLYIMLSYLAHRGLATVATPIVSRLASRQDIVRTPERLIIHRLLDTYLIEGRPFIGRFGQRHPMIGRTLLNSMLVPGSHIGKIVSLPWSIFFPPWVPERYSFDYHIQRLARLLRAKS